MDKTHHYDPQMVSPGEVQYLKFSSSAVFGSPEQQRATVQFTIDTLTQENKDLVDYVYLLRSKNNELADELDNAYNTDREE